MDSKQRIYECAKILFFEEGFKSTTKRRVSELSGINQSMINYYFKELGNVAGVIFAENYQIIFSYVVKYTDSVKDPLLADAVYEFVIHRICSASPLMARFVSEASGELLNGSKVYNYVAKSHLNALIGMADKKVLKNTQIDALFSALRLGIKSYYFVTCGSGKLSDDKFREYIGFMIRNQMYALGRIYKDDEVADIIGRAEEISTKLLDENPELSDPSVYLYHKSILKDEPVLDLLDNVKFE